MALKSRNRTEECRKNPVLLKDREDSELVALVEEGLPEAFQVLVDRYDALVRSVVGRIIRNDRMLVEDACQETFLKALSCIGDLRNSSRFRSWLCAIARNQALDSIRRAKSTCSLEMEYNDEVIKRWVVDPKANPEEKLARIEVAGIMQDILSEIPDLYRDPITLRFEEDLDYQDIAEILGKPLGTIKSLIHRGKLLIRKEVTRRAWGSDGARVLAG